MLIECKNLSASYENREVLKNVNFSVEENDYVCIVGENGTGKSTLVKCLLNLKAPSKGSIVYNKQIKKGRIGYLPQQSLIKKDFPASVSEVVLSGCLNSLGARLFYSKKHKERAEYFMHLMNICNLKKSSFQELSGGQKQRVLLARAMCAAEKLIVMDEPVTGLDPIVTEEFYEAVEKLNKEENVAVVMISHNVKEAVKHAKHILHLSESSQFYGTAEEYSLSETGKRFMGGAND